LFLQDDPGNAVRFHSPIQLGWTTPGALPFWEVINSGPEWEELSAIFHSFIAEQVLDLESTAIWSVSTSCRQARSFRSGEVEAIPYEFHQD
jgi:hypothetical protein